MGFPCIPNYQIGWEDQPLFLGTWNVLIWTRKKKAFLGWREEALACVPLWGRRKECTIPTRRRTFFHRGKPFVHSLWRPFEHEDSRRNRCAVKISAWAVEGQRDTHQEEKKAKVTVSDRLDGFISCRLWSPLFSNLLIFLIFNLNLSSVLFWYHPWWWPETN